MNLYFTLVDLFDYHYFYLLFLLHCIYLQISVVNTFYKALLRHNDVIDYSIRE